MSARNDSIPAARASSASRSTSSVPIPRCWQSSATANATSPTLPSRTSRAIAHRLAFDVGDQHVMIRVDAGEQLQVGRKEHVLRAAEPEPARRRAEPVEDSLDRRGGHHAGAAESSGRRCTRDCMRPCCRRAMACRVGSTGHLYEMARPGHYASSDGAGDSLPRLRGAAPRLLDLRRGRRRSSSARAGSRISRRNGPTPTSGRSTPSSPGRIAWCASTGSGAGSRRASSTRDRRSSPKVASSKR